MRSFDSPAIKEASPPGVDPLRVAEDRRGSESPSPPEGASSPEDGWSTLDSLPVPLLRLSPKGVVLAANRHARSLLPVPNVVEIRLSDLLEGLGRPVGKWVADVAAGRPTNGPQFLRGKGEQQDVFLRVALNPAGPPEDPHLLAVLTT